MKTSSITSYSRRLAASYVLDWIVIIAIAAVGGGLNFVTPYHRPFSLLDLSLSYPYIPESITTGTLVLVTLVAPAIIIALVVFLFVPGPSFCRNQSRSQIVRLKLWEFEKGWAGLALSVAAAFFFTQGSKNLFGKPRPDMLARCKPDLSNISAHVVGGYGQDISARWTLVNSSICTSTDFSVLNDGFRSFPSGHNSFAWSGLLYLSLFLCSKFAIVIPFLTKESTPRVAGLARPEDHQLLPLHNRGRNSTEDAADKSADSRASTGGTAEELPIRNRAAAPPVHLLVIAFLPIAVAFYIGSTRYVQFYHDGFDIISGSLIGILSAWFAFRWYHLPIRSGQGWAWGARTRNNAFGVGVGTRNYIGEEGWHSTRSRATAADNA